MGGTSSEEDTVMSNGEVCAQREEMVHGGREGHKDAWIACNQSFIIEVLFYAFSPMCYPVIVLGTTFCAGK